MNLTTEFDLGAKVWIGRAWFGPERRPCPTCHGAMRVSAMFGDVVVRAICPECDGGGYRWFDTDQRSVKGPMTVGRVEMRVTASGDHREEESYMLEETGVGSGSCYARRDGDWGTIGIFANAGLAEKWCDAKWESAKAERAARAVTA